MAFVEDNCANSSRSSRCPRHDQLQLGLGPPCRARKSSTAKTSIPPDADTRILGSAQLRPAVFPKLRLDLRTKKTSLPPNASTLAVQQYEAHNLLVAKAKDRRRLVIRATGSFPRDQSESYGLLLYRQDGYTYRIDTCSSDFPGFCPAVPERYFAVFDFRLLQLKGPGQHRIANDKGAWRGTRSPSPSAVDLHIALE